MAGWFVMATALGEARRFLRVDGSARGGVIPVMLGCLTVAALLVVVPWMLALLLPLSAAATVLILLVRRCAPSSRATDALLLWTLGSLFLHLAVGALITYTSLVHYFGPDALGYHNEALELARQWRGSVTGVTLSSGKEGFYYMLAGLYWLLGAHPISGLVVNAACAAALIPVSSFVTSRLFGEGPTRWVPGLLTLTPAFLVWPSQLLREGPILLLIAVAAASAVCLTERLRPWPVLGLVATLLLLFTFRSSVALLMAGGLLVGVALGLRRLWVGLSLQTVVLAVLVILMVGLGFGYSGFRLATQVDLQDVEAFRAATAQEAGSAITAGDVSSIRGAVVTLPVGMARVLLGPFPWEIGLRQLPALVDGAFMWALLIPGLLGLREGWRRRGRRLLPLLLPAALLSALLAVVIGNYGLLLRERTQMMILVVPLVALGLERVFAAERRSSRSKLPVRLSAPSAGSP